MAQKLSIEISADPSSLKKAAMEAAEALDQLKRRGESLAEGGRKNEAAAERYIEKLKMEALQLAAGEAAVRKYQLSKMNLADAAQREANALIDNIDSLKRGAPAQESMTASVFKGAAAADIATKAFGALVDTYHRIKEATREMQQVEAREQALLNATGEAASGKREIIDRLAQSMSKLTKFDDDLVKSTASQLLPMGLANDKFERAIKLGGDLAVTYNRDLTGATQSLARSLVEPGEGLRQLETMFGKLDPALKAQIKSLMEMNEVAQAQDLILRDVASRVEGVAEKSYVALERQTIGVKKATDDLFKALGRQIFDEKSKEAGLLERALRSTTDFVEAKIPVWQKGLLLLNGLMNPAVAAGGIAGAVATAKAAEASGPLSADDQREQNRFNAQASASEARAEATAKRERAAENVRRIQEELRTDNEKMAKEIVIMRKNAADMGLAADEQDNLEARIRQKYTKKTEKDRSDTLLDNSRKALAIATAELANGTDRLTAAERALEGVRESESFRKAPAARQLEIVDNYKRAAALEQLARAQKYAADEHARDVAAIGQQRENLAGMANAWAEETDALRQSVAAMDLTNSGREKAALLIKRNQDLLAAGGDAATIRDINAAYEEQLNLIGRRDGKERELQFWDELGAKVNTFSQAAIAAFGGVGTALGGIVSGAAAFAEQADKIERQRQKDANSDPARLAEINQKAARATAAAQIKSYGDMTAAAKSFFKEDSKGRQVMEAAEKGFRALEAAMALENFLLKTDHVATFLGLKIAADAQAATSSTAAAAAEAAAAATSGQANALAAVANQGNGDPYSAFFRIAAMAAIMAALGFAVGGGGGGPSVDIAKERQEAAGKGTVFGNSGAKSASIERSLKILQDNSETGLDYSSGMLSALRNIETGISRMAGTIIRATGLRGGEGDTAGLNLGGSVGGFSGRGRSLADQGLYAGPQTVGSVVQNGFQGQTFSDVTVSVRSWWRTRTHIETVFGELDATIKQQFGTIIADMRSSVLQAVAVFGDAGDGIADVLDALQIDIGKISFKGMTGAQIEEQLQAIFGKLGDQMANAALPGLDKFAKVGEGGFETLIRLATEYKRVDAIMLQLGRTFGATGVASIEARDRLVELAGGLDEFTQRSQYFAQHFLTDAQRLAPAMASVNKELARMGLTGIENKEQFADVVRGLDLTTEAGAQMYADLMRLAPAFNDISEYIDQLTGNLRDLKGEAYSFAREIGGKINATGGNVDLSALSANRVSDLRASYSGLRGAANRQDAIRNYVGAVDDWLADRQAAAQRQAQAMQSAQSAINAAQKSAIDTRIKGLQEELKIAQAMKSVMDKADAALTKMRTGNSNPFGAQAQLGAAGDDVQALLGQFRGASGQARADLANRLIDAVNTRQSLAESTMQRPGSDYLALYNDNMAIYTEVRDAAKTEADRAYDLQLRIAAMQEQANGIGNQQIDVDAYTNDLMADANREARGYYEWAQAEFEKNNAAQQAEAAAQLALATSSHKALTDINSELQTLNATIAAFLGRAASGAAAASSASSPPSAGSGVTVNVTVQDSSGRVSPASIVEAVRQAAPEIKRVLAVY